MDNCCLGTQEQLWHRSDLDKAHSGFLPREKHFRHYKQKYNYTFYNPNHLFYLPIVSYRSAINRPMAESNRSRLLSGCTDILREQLHAIATIDMAIPTLIIGF